MAKNKKDFGKILGYDFYKIKEQCKRREDIIKKSEGTLPAELEVDFQELDLEDIIEVQRQKVLDHVRNQLTAIVDENDIRTLTPQKPSVEILKNASAVPMICHKNHLEIGVRKSKLRNYKESLGNYYNLCGGEPFRDEAFTLAIQTGFVYDRNIIATALHCLNQYSDVSDMRFIFGYTAARLGQNPPMFIPNANIYEGKRLVKDSTSSGMIDGGDWALIELTKPLDDSIPTLVRRSSGSLSDYAKLYTIGYPLGLSLKLSGNAIVTKNELSSPIFSASLDAFISNSGSPVFNEETHEVEGILHFVYGDINPGDCRTLSRGVLPDTLGSEITRITSVKI